MTPYAQVGTRATQKMRYETTRQNMFSKDSTPSINELPMPFTNNNVSSVFFQEFHVASSVKKFIISLLSKAAQREKDYSDHIWNAPCKKKGIRSEILREQKKSNRTEKERNQPMIRKTPGKNRSFITTMEETKIFMKLEFFFLLALIEIFVCRPWSSFQKPKRNSGGCLHKIFNKF